MAFKTETNLTPKLTVIWPLHVFPTCSSASFYSQYSSCQTVLCTPHVASICTFSPKSWPQHTIFPLLGTILPPFPSSLQFPSIVVWSLNLTLCDPVDCSSPGSSVLGIPQGRILEWVAIFISRRLPQPRDWTHFSCIGKWILDHWAPPGKPQFTANSPLQPQPNSALKKKPYSGISLAQCCHHHSLLFTTLGAFIMIAQCLFYPKDHLSCEEEPIWLHSYIAVPGMQWCSSEYLLNIWIY